MGLNWHGDRVIRRMRQATRLGINRTMAAGVAAAKQNHEWQNRTGTAERSIRVALPAQTGPDGKTIGVWGSVAVKYFWALEFGRIVRGIRTTLKGRFVKKTTAPKAYPTLRPAAKKVYVMLPAYIKAAWKSLGK